MQTASVSAVSSYRSDTWDDGCGDRGAEGAGMPGVDTEPVSLQHRRMIGWRDGTKARCTIALPWSANVAIPGFVPKNPSLIGHLESTM